MNVTRIDTAAITEWQDIYPREGLDESVVRELEALIEEGAELDPIVVTPLPGQAGRYALIDGAHRLTAFANRGILQVECIIIESPDGVDEKSWHLWALAEAARRNLRHGKALTRKERKAVIERLYAGGLSVTEIAARLGVTAAWVSRVLRPLREAEKQAQRAQVIELIRSGLSMREAAREVGVGRATVSRWTHAATAQPVLADDMALRQGPEAAYPVHAVPSTFSASARPEDIEEGPASPPPPPSSGGENVWEAAYRDWAAGMKTEEVAKKYGLPLAVVRYRKNVDGWAERAQREWQERFNGQLAQDPMSRSDTLTGAESWLFREQRFPVYGVGGGVRGWSTWEPVAKLIRRFPGLPPDVEQAIQEVEEAFERGEAHYVEWAQPEYSSRWSDLLEALAWTVIKGVELAEWLKKVSPEVVAEMVARKAGTRVLVEGILLALLDEVAIRISDMLSQAGYFRPKAS